MQEDNNAGWAYKSDNPRPNDYGQQNAVAASSSIGAEGKVVWSASEYIANARGAAWFLGLAGLIALICAVIYFLSRDWISIGAVAIIGVAVGVFASQEPKVLEYSVDNTGFKIGPKEYPFSLFRSFSIVQEGAFRSISLYPLRRFMPPLSIHYDPQDEKKIFDSVSNFLPYEEYKEDVIDNLSRKLRF